MKEIVVGRIEITIPDSVLVNDRVVVDTLVAPGDDLSPNYVPGTNGELTGTWGRCMAAWAHARSIGWATAGQEVDVVRWERSDNGS